jgi:hypothetical protein
MYNENLVRVEVTRGEAVSGDHLIDPNSVVVPHSTSIVVHASFRTVTVGAVGWARVTSVYIGDRSTMAARRSRSGLPSPRPSISMSISDCPMSVSRSAAGSLPISAGPEGKTTTRHGRLRDELRRCTRPRSRRCSHHTSSVRATETVECETPQGYCRVIDRPKNTLQRAYSASQCTLERHTPRAQFVLGTT